MNQYLKNTFFTLTFIQHETKKKLSSFLFKQTNLLVTFDPFPEIVGLSSIVHLIDKCHIYIQYLYKYMIYNSSFGRYQRFNCHFIAFQKGDIGYFGGPQQNYCRIFRCKKLTKVVVYHKEQFDTKKKLPQSRWR